MIKYPSGTRRVWGTHFGDNNNDIQMPWTSLLLQEHYSPPRNYMIKKNCEPVRTFTSDISADYTCIFQPVVEDTGGLVITKPQKNRTLYDKAHPLCKDKLEKREGIWKVIGDCLDMTGKWLLLSTLPTEHDKVNT